MRRWASRALTQILLAPLQLPGLVKQSHLTHLTLWSSVAEAHCTCIQLLRCQEREKPRCIAAMWKRQSYLRATIQILISVAALKTFELQTELQGDSKLYMAVPMQCPILMLSKCQTQKSSSIITSWVTYLSMQKVVDGHNPVQCSGFRIYTAADVGYDGQTCTDCKWRDRNDWFLQPHSRLMRSCRAGHVWGRDLSCSLVSGSSNSPERFNEKLPPPYGSLPIIVAQGLCLKALLQRGSHQAEVETMNGKSSETSWNYEINLSTRIVLDVTQLRRSGNHQVVSQCSSSKSLISRTSRSPSVMTPWQEVEQETSPCWTNWRSVTKYKKRLKESFRCKNSPAKILTTGYTASTKVYHHGPTSGAWQYLCCRLPFLQYSLAMSEPWKPVSGAVRMQVIFFLSPKLQALQYGTSDDASTRNTKEMMLSQDVHERSIWVLELWTQTTTCRK